MASDFGLVSELYESCDELVDAVDKIDIGPLETLSRPTAFALIAQVYQTYFDVMRRNALAARTEFAKKLVESDDIYLASHAQGILGFIDFLNRDLKQACARFRTSHDGFLSIAQHDDAIKALQRETTLSREFLQPDEVMTLCNEGLELCRSSPKRSVLYSLAFQNIIAGELVRSGRMKAAETMVSKAAKSALNIPLSPISAQAFYEYGQLQAEKHRYKPAVVWLLRAHDWFSKAKQPVTFSILMVLMRCYLSLNMYEQAFQMAEAIAKHPRAMTAPKDWTEGLSEAIRLAIDLFQIQKAEPWLALFAEQDDESVVAMLSEKIQLSKQRLSRAVEISPVRGFPFLEAKKYEQLLFDAKNWRITTVNSQSEIVVFSFKENALARELLETLIEQRLQSSNPYKPDTARLKPSDRQRLNRALTSLKENGLLYESEANEFFLLPLSRCVVVRD